MIVRNEIIETNQTILLKFPINSTSYNYDGQSVVLIAQYSAIMYDVINGNPVHIQTWEVRLPNGNKTIARIIDWLGKN